MNHLPRLAAQAQARERVWRAQRITDQRKGDERLHRLGTETVFVLEDLAFALRQGADASGDGEDEGKAARP